MSEPLTDEELEFYAAREHVQASRVSEMARELRAHRAWRAKLGDPDTWFPALARITQEAEPYVYRQALLSLSLEARALVERAKEGT